MLRILLILGLIAAIVVLSKRLVSDKKNKQRSPHKLQSSKMVKCAHCELYTPEDEALKSDGRYFCSAKHLELANKGSQK